MSFMVPAKATPSSSLGGRSYGWRHAAVQIAFAAVFGLGLAGAAVPVAQAQAPVQVPMQVVALGDSLTAGYGLPESDGFVPRLQAALTAKGIAATVQNAGVSGDTAADGLARLDWSVPEGTQAVIVELGANDMLRGGRPDVTRQVLDQTLRRLTDRHIAVLLCGMLAAPNLGADYGRAFDSIYPDLAAKYGALLYPFFLDGVAGDRSLTQPDGLHPNAKGVDVIVEHIMPKVEELIAHVHSQHPA
jgi:acyl-CoA thioesterase-1